MPSSAWPELPYAAWKDTLETLHRWTQIAGKVRLKLTPWTLETLHRWTQIAGKVRLKLTPWLNHSWHVTLYVSARGLTTGPIPADGCTLEIEFDFLDHVLWLRTSDGQLRQIALRPLSVARFYEEVMADLRGLGIDVRIHEMPNEIPGAVRFPKDQTHTSYDGEAVRRFHRVLLSCNEVFTQFRTRFLGKATPSHFFWGSFDLAVTRFSGRRAPVHPGGVPGLPDAVTREAYSHEVSSAGFWPGSAPLEYPAFYSYAYAPPEGFSAAKVKPGAAFWSKELGEFILPYDAVRKEKEPARELMLFLQSTYEAAADLAKWDRAALDGELGERGKVRVLSSP